MTPDHIAQINVPSDPRVSPDGTQVAFVVSTPNLEDDRYDRVIWVENEQFTPSLKIRRHVIKQVYGERLDALYKR